MQRKKQPKGKKSKKKLSADLLVEKTQKLIDERKIKSKTGLCREENELFWALAKKGKLSKLTIKTSAGKRELPAFTREELVDYARNFISSRNIKNETELQDSHWSLFEMLRTRKLLEKIDFQKEYSLEVAVDKIISLIKDKKERPILVSVYGTGKSGKSYLIKKLQNEFEKLGMRFAGFSSNPDPAHFYRVEKWGNSGLLPDVAVFHCSWHFITENDAEDPNMLAKEILGKPVDLNVGIYNPKTDPGPAGNFDLIVRNPH